MHERFSPSVDRSPGHSEQILQPVRAPLHGTLLWRPHVAGALSGMLRPVETEARNGSSPSGTGLDLAIAYCITEGHGGAIQVSSTPGIGATILVTFPVTVEEAQLLAVTS